MSEVPLYTVDYEAPETPGIRGSRYQACTGKEVKHVKMTGTNLQMKISQSAVWVGTLSLTLSHSLTRTHTLTHTPTLSLDLAPGASAPGRRPKQWLQERAARRPAPGLLNPAVPQASAGLRNPAVQQASAKRRPACLTWTLLRKAAPGSEEGWHLRLIDLCITQL